MYAGVPTVDFGCESNTADCRAEKVYQRHHANDLRFRPY